MWYKSIFEVLMLLTFGAAWPFSIARSYKARTAKGKSPAFLLILLTGYVFGIINKIVNNSVDYVVFFYALNLVMVGMDYVLYLRNARYDKINSTN